jgi:hypothetical protein
VLDHDLDLLFLLPDGDVEEGDSWTVEGDALRSLVAPGGQLGLVFASPPEGDFELLEPLQVACASLLTAAEAAGEVDGELEVTWAETVEVDGERRALLELELEVTLSRDLGERVGEVLGGAVTLPPGLRLASDWELEGEGVCAWSLDAGTARSLRLELDTTLVAAVTLTAYGTEVESEYALEGTTVLDFAFEAD